MISTCSRGTGASMLLSPACGPAAVTSVPVTSCAAKTTAVRIVNCRNGFGTRAVGTPSSGSPIFTYSSTASHTIAIDTSRWIATVHHSRPVSTVMPPITACTTVDAGISQAYTRTSRRRRARVTASTASAAVSTTRKVIIRLPNSTAWWIPGTSACGTGVKLPGKHCGQVGQPRPDAVTRTMAPVTAMPPWVRTTAAAMSRCARRLGIGSTSTSAHEKSSDGHGPIVEDRNYSS